jgi:hypothetical protein
MSAAADLDTILQIATAVAGSTSAVLAAILAWQAPKIIKEVLAFVRGLINDLRKTPRQKEEKSKTQQRTSVDPAG